MEIMTVADGRERRRKEISMATEEAKGRSKFGALLDKIFGAHPGDGEMQSGEAISFSLCGFGQNIICAVIGSYLMIFMTDAMRYDALMVAFLMLGARVFDALNDPIMGSIVDRTRTKWGKCRPYLKWMAIPIAVMTVICFLPWYPENDGGFAAMSVMYVVWGIIYTVADVPYWGLSTAMTNDTYRRGNMLTVARLFCTVGMGLVTMSVPIIAESATKGLDPDAAAERLKMTYFAIAVVCAAVGTPFFFIGFRNTRERNLSETKAPTLGHNLRLLFKNRPLMLIVLSGILGSARMLFTFTGGLYFAKYVMRRESLYALFSVAIIPGGLIGSLFVPYCTKKFGKRNTYAVSHLIGGAALLVAFILGIVMDNGDYTGAATVAALMIALVVAGFPMGLGNIITYAMIGDTVEYLEDKTGERAEGICFAMQTFINKIGMAVGAFVGLLAYHMAGIEANDANSLDAEGKNIMWTMLILTGAISFFLSVVPLLFYKFDERRQREAVERIKARKEAEARRAASCEEGADGCM